MFCILYFCAFASSMAELDVDAFIECKRDAARFLMMCEAFVAGDDSMLQGRDTVARSECEREAFEESLVTLTFLDSTNEWRPLDGKVSGSDSLGYTCFPEICASNLVSAPLKKAGFCANGFPRSAPADLGLPLRCTEGNGFHSPLNAKPAPSVKSMPIQENKPIMSLLNYLSLQFSTTKGKLCGRFARPAQKGT
jgi:hypothetical protein